jgi:hypothetical protein
MEKRGNRLGLVYRNAYTGATWDCGTAYATEEMALAWIVGGACARHGDTIVLPDGNVLLFLKPEARAKGGEPVCA